MKQESIALKKYHCLSLMVLLVYSTLSTAQEQICKSYIKVWTDM
jgi:hypothetical protein